MKFLCTDFHGEAPVAVTTSRSFHRGITIPIKLFLFILLFLPHFLSAQCACSSGSGNLLWESGNWPEGSMNEAFTIAVPGEDPLGVDIQFSTAALGSFYNFGFNWPIVDAPGGTPNYFGAEADVGIIFNPNPGQGHIPIVIEVTFDRPITCFSFEVSDIDISGTDRKDQVVITSDVGDPVLSTVGANPTVGISGNTASATGLGGSGGASSSDSDGTILADFDGLVVTSVTITYNEVSGNSNPAGRGIGLFGQFSVCPAIVTGAISGTVLEDINGDGIGDNPVPAGTVIELLDENGDPVLDTLGVAITTTTLADGSYIFAELDLGTYQVQEQDPTGFTSVSDTDGGDMNLSTVTLSSTQLEGVVGFIDEQLASISGTVLEDTDGDGIGDVPVPAGTVITLLDGNGDPVLDGAGVAITTTTDAAGDYTFSAISPGSYQVEESDPTNYTSVSDTDGGDEGNTVVNPAPGEDLTGIDFIDEMSGSISGTVFVDTDGDNVGDTPSEGAEITLLDALGNVVLDDAGDPFVTTTAADGTYTFDDVPSGTYQVVETNVFGYGDVSDTDSGDPNNTGVVVGAGQSVENIDFVDVKVGTISGTLLEDIDGDGVGDDPEPGLVVALLNTDGTPVLDENGVAVEATTDADGFYSFIGVVPGDYLVQATDPAGFNSVSDTDGGDENQASVSVVGLEDVMGINFVDEEPGTISGTIYEDTDGDGVGDVAMPVSVTITLLDEDGNVVATATTDTDGTYTFTDVPPGNYEVVESDDIGYMSVADTDGGSPDSTSVSLSPGEDLASIDFVDEIAASISGTVLEDIDGDGVGDIPVPAGTVISLLDKFGNPILDDSGNPVTTTTAADGTYSFTGLPAATYIIVETDPTDFASVSDTDGGKVNRTVVPVAQGENVTGIDFIDEQLSSISGTALVDTDMDGTGDNPVPAGTLISLFDAAGDPVLDNAGNPVTTTTAADGTYSFTDISPGVYQVVETDPDTYMSAGDTDGGDVNSTLVNLAPGTDVTGIDFLDEVTCKISGNVFNDGNGLTDNYVNGTGIADPSSSQLYITLLDALGNFVADVPVNPDGTYEFLGIRGGDYTLQVNDPAASPGLPAGWENTGEYVGDVVGDDGSVDGKISLTVSTEDITYVNFGIEIIPVADDFAEPTQPNPGDNMQVTVPTLSGNDMEDGVKGAGDDIIIQTLPNDATLYYDGQPVVAGTTILGYNPALLTIDPIDGNVTPSFTYSFIDNAGKESVPATVVMSFQAALPIELFNFTITKDGRKAILKWATASERNNNYFEIERSTDGVNFADIYKVDGKGTTTAVSHYDYTDSRTMGGHNYYRIKQVDYDRSFSYSEIKSVYFDRTDEVNVYPNPTNGAVTINNGTNMPFMLQVYAPDGKLVKKVDSATLNTGQLIDISSLSDGHYYFKFIFENGTVKSKQVQLISRR